MPNIRYIIVYLKWNFKSRQRFAVQVVFKKLNDTYQSPYIYGPVEQKMSVS